jgi:hypothetical protein
VSAGETKPDVDLAGVKSLADAARLFFSEPVPRLLAGHAAIALTTERRASWRAPSCPSSSSGRGSR